MTSNSNKMVYKSGVAEIAEKKSRFIANTYSIQDEEEVSSYINMLKKQYWDARHHCYAYVLGDSNQIQRYSDDGEPAGTAGKPILEVITSQGIRNCLIVVTRYFGGTLLGTGGLVRAYGLAAKEGLNNSVLIEKKLGNIQKVIVDYNLLTKIQYIVNTMSLYILHIEYEDVVTLKIIMPIEEVQAFENKIIEATSAKVKIEDVGNQYYSDVKGTVVLLS